MADLDVGVDLGTGDLTGTTEIRIEAGQVVQASLSPADTIHLDQMLFAAQMMADMRRAIEPPRPDPAEILLAHARREFHRARGEVRQLEHLRWETRRLASVAPVGGVEPTVYDPTDPRDATAITFHAIMFGRRGRYDWHWQVDGPAGDATDLAIWLRQNGPQPFFDLYQQLSRDYARHAGIVSHLGERNVFRHAEVPVTATPYERWYGGLAPPNRAAAAHREAVERGEKLLREWLTPEQLAQYERHAWFEVIGSESQRRYRIRPAGAFNVDLLRADGSVEEQICFMPAGSLVNGDIMLAQKIALETSEPEALKVANRKWVGGSRPPDSWLAAQFDRITAWRFGS